MTKGHKKCRQGFGLFSYIECYSWKANIPFPGKQAFSHPPPQVYYFTHICMRVCIYLCIYPFLYMHTYKKPLILHNMISKITTYSEDLKRLFSKSKGLRQNKRFLQSTMWKILIGTLLKSSFFLKPKTFSILIHV